MIDNKKYKANQKSYYRKSYKKNKIILYDSFRKNNYHVIRLLNKEKEEHKEWNTYTINRNGRIFEHFNPKYYGDYFGDKKIDQESISIVLENIGGLEFDEKSNVFYNGLYEFCDNKNIYQKNWKGFTFWEKYTDKQFESLIKLCKKLCNDFNIPCKSIGFNNFNENTENFNGILCRSNLENSYYDLNPSFDFVTFKNKME